MALIIYSRADGCSCLRTIPAFAETGQGGGGARRAGGLGPVHGEEAAVQAAFPRVPSCLRRAASSPWVLAPGSGTLQLAAGSWPVSGCPVGQSPLPMCADRRAGVRGAQCPVRGPASIQASWWLWVLTQRGGRQALFGGHPFWIYVRESCSHRIVLFPPLPCRVVMEREQ